MSGRPGTRRRLGVVAACVVVVLLLGEGATRFVQDDLPLPRRWSSPEAVAKEQAVLALEAAGGAGVVYLGSSGMGAAADPSAGPAPGGRPGYNASISAGSLTMIDTWGRLYAIPRLHPDVVVLGLSSRELNPNDPVQRARTADFMASPGAREATGTETIVQRIGRRLGGLSALIEYRSVLRQPAQLWAGLRGAPFLTGEFGELLGPSGHLEAFLGRSFVRDDRTIPSLRAAVLHDWTIGIDEVASARRFLVAMRDAGIQVVLVDMPVTQTFVDAHPAGAADFARTAAALSTLAAESGATFVDAGVWPDDLFADAVHLNGSGTARFMAELSPVIESTLAD